MNDMQQLEKRLASLQGYKVLKMLPRWTADDAAAFQLMVEYDCWPADSYGFGTEGMENYIDVNWADGCDITEDIVDFQSKAEAVRVAIVKAVIAKLESQ